MKKTISKIMGIALVLVLFCSCSSNKTTATYYKYETECLGVELDGSQTLWVWGTGKDKADAMEQAAKNAVNDIIFKGIHSGDASCAAKPLLLEVNAKEKYEDYFNVFFRDGGAYVFFVSREDTRRRSEVKQTSDKQQKYGVTIRVKRSELKQKLIADNILKQ